jgi:hypothetical protein
MPVFEFTMALSAPKTHSIYRGQARYILVASDQGLKLQIPAANFRGYVTRDGIHGRFRVEIDAHNKILLLRRL